VVVCAFVLNASLAFAAADAADKKELPVPRFVSLATDEVNLRTGPGLRYPIRLIIRKEGLPVEVIREFEVWRQVRDAEGDEGWVHKSMLSGKRGAVLKGSVQPLLKAPDDGAVPVARLEPGVVVAVETCQEKWCKVSVAQFDGWVNRDKIWGVYPQEQIAR
jgi:SH3-like domain-containing protein